MVQIHIVIANLHSILSKQNVFLVKAQALANGIY